MQVNNLEIIVLGGGTSPEREVSLRSSKSVFESLSRQGFNVVFQDPKYTQEYLSAGKKTIVLPILHGEGGEDGAIQELLESKGIPFLGASSLSSKNCFDKQTTRQILQQKNVPIAKGAFLSFNDYITSDFVSKPHVVKSPGGGSSIGTFIVRDINKHAPQSLKKEFGDSKMVVEELIEGDELTVPILDDFALPVIEIIPPNGAEFDYKNKYNGRSQELCPPVSISLQNQKKAQSIAENVHQILGCRHLSRVDIMLDRNNDFYVLEINTIPGLTDQSLYPKAANVYGLSMDQLVHRFVELVAIDYGLIS